MNENAFDTCSSFEIKYSFFDESHETEISLLVDGKNILAFTRDGCLLTTRWNLDELANWLRSFLDHLCEDAFPIEIDGEYAAMKDRNAREFDSDDDAEFDAYYDMLDAWNLRHRWHPASSGAVLADVYFQMVDDHVELSWNNESMEENIQFVFQLGGCKVRKDEFISTVNAFLTAYALHWFS